MLQTADELLALGCPGGGEHLLVRGPRPSQPDVLLQGAVKEEVVLGDEADFPGELFQRQFPDVPPAQGNGAAGHIPEPGRQSGDGGLSAAGGAHQSGELPLGDGQVQTVEHFLSIAAAVGEGHILQLNTASIQGRILLRLGQLGQIQQLPGVLHRKLHALHGVDESGGAHERGHDPQRHHQAQRHLSWVQHSCLIEVDPHGQRPQQGGGQDGEAQVHGGPGTAVPVHGERLEGGHRLGELLIGPLPLAEGLHHLDALHILHDDAVDLGVGFHVGGVVLVIAPHPKGHGDQGQGDGHQQGQPHPPVDREHGDDHHQRQQNIGTEFRDHVGQGRLDVLYPVHDGALHGPNGPGLHLPQGRPHKPVRRLEAQTLQNGVGRHMGQHGGQGVARHLDGVTRQTHTAPEQDVLPVGLPLQKQPDDLIDTKVWHKATRHTEDGQHHRGGHLPPAGCGKGQKDTKPGPLLHTQHSSQRKIVVVRLR